MTARMPPRRREYFSRATPFPNGTRKRKELSVMVPEREEVKRRRYAIPVLVLLLALAIGAYLLQSGIRARDNSEQAFVPHRAAPSGAPSNANAVADTGTTAAYKTLPNGVRIGHSSKNDTSPPLRDIPPAAY